MSDETTVVALTERQLDELAVEAAEAAAAVFAAAGWTYGSTEQFVPTGPFLAVRTRRKLDDCTLDHTLSSGRIAVTRFIEDGVEQASVTLDLGSAVAR